ncbi:DUF2339 domain-containing protein [Candidatus Thiodictyon syntrophicum]|nr:DUF2339 domain-containing protein [Candidatus Thiodictyon syntrophicum]
MLSFARAALRRRGARPVWVAGALLLVPAVVKRPLLDLAVTGTVARIVAFIGVGVMMIAIGSAALRAAAATGSQSLMTSQPGGHEMPLRRMKQQPATARRRCPALLLSLLAAAFSATADPRLRCQIEQGGTVQVLDVAPVADPYSVAPVTINGRFRFKAVVIGDARRIAYINLYTYFQTERRLVLLHQAKYIAPTIASDPAATLTGWNYLYSPGRERELQYRCTLVEVAP